VDDAVFFVLSRICSLGVKRFRPPTKVTNHTAYWIQRALASIVKEFASEHGSVTFKLPTAIAFHQLR